MKPVTVVFFGRSGSGKGTQAALLAEYLKAKDPSIKVDYIETGDRARAFIKGETHTAKKIREIIHAGGLMPAFIPIWLWATMLIEEFSGSEHLIFDGVARRPEEAPILDSALQLYGRRPHIVFLDVPKEEVVSRLIKRGRNDDVPEKIESRLAWYVTDVLPVLEYFKQSKNVDFVRVDGHQTIENVQREVLKALGV